jgi:RNA polymerase sigma factor (sigma-70 family)
VVLRKLVPRAQLDDPPAVHGRPTDRPDHTWFTGIYEAHHAAIVRYGLRRLGDKDAAIDLAQEVFVIAWRRRGEVPEPSLPWLYGVARRLLANEWRARRATPDWGSRTEADEASVSNGESDTVVALVDLRAALAHITEADRDVLLLVAWEGLSVAELAVALNCSRTAAKVRLHRARRRLGAAMTARRRPPTIHEGT